MSIKRTPALDTSHPFSGLAQPDEDAAASTTETAATTTAPAEAPAKAAAPAAPAASPPAPAAALEPYAGSTQFNIRASETMRDHLRVAAAGMTLATGQKWSQDRLVRHAVAAYLAQLADEYNNGRPFHERG